MRTCRISSPPSGGALSRRALLGAGLGLAVTPGAAWARGAEADVVGAGGVIVSASGARGIVLAGRTRATGGRALFANDEWHIGSNTKAMTAALYARMVEAGRCRWGASVAVLFPDLRADGAWGGVTVEQLMSHSAGLSDAGIDAAWLRARHADGSDVRAQRTAFAQAVLSRPPAGTPGAYAYGNASYLLLGAAIERAAECSWEDAMRRDLFAPLGMSSAGFGAPPSAGVWGHGASPSGPVPADPGGVADNPAALGPAGRVHLGLSDYARFLGAYLGGGLLRPDTLARLLTPAAGSAYAGGWSVSADASVLAHEGSNTLWYAIARLHPARGIGYAAVVNEGGAKGRAGALAMLARVNSGSGTG